jgi:hypothetical protein
MKKAKVKNTLSFIEERFVFFFQGRKKNLPTNVSIAQRLFLSDRMREKKHFHQTDLIKIR